MTAHSDQYENPINVVLMRINELQVKIITVTRVCYRVRNRDGCGSHNIT